MTSTHQPPRGVVSVVDDAGPTRYAELLRDSRTTGRSPVWLGRSGADRLGMVPVPEHPRAMIDAVSPETVLSGWWPGPCPPGCRCLVPFTDGFPAELVRARREDRCARPGFGQEAMAFAQEVAPFSVLASVGAARPADIPAVVGWGGTVNYPHQELAELCAVLRSWEERFGAVLTYLSSDILLLAVDDPPRTRDEAERAAAEHFAFCPDQHDPQDGTVHTPRSYARTIRGARRWRFWWD